MIAWLFGLDDSLGDVRPWNPMIAERHAKVTERLLTGCVLSVTVTDAETIQRERFWQQQERKIRGRVQRLG